MKTQIVLTEQLLGAFNEIACLQEKNERLIMERTSWQVHNECLKDEIVRLKNDITTFQARADKDHKDFMTLYHLLEKHGIAIPEELKLPF